MRVLGSEWQPRHGGGKRAQSLGRAGIGPTDRPGAPSSVARMALTRRAVLAAALTAACSPTRLRSAPVTPSARPSRTGGGTLGPTTPDPSAPAVATGGPAVEITHGPRTGTAVALTFHGAGDPRLATALLGELERAGARATVLAVGTWLQANPSMARRILDAGHDLGNHTQTHPTLPRLGAAACYREIEECRQVLERLTGGPGRWFRPSGTPHATPLIATAAGRAGYRSTLSYDVDPRDYADPGASAVAARTLAAVRPGSIISLHLGHDGTVAALPTILDGLRVRGLAPATVTRLLAA